MVECKRDEPAILWVLRYLEEVEHNDRSRNGMLPVDGAAKWLHDDPSKTEDALVAKLSSASDDGYFDFDMFW